MGFYINHRNQSKERFLHEKGSPISEDSAKRVLSGGSHLPVCLVNNGPFTAAAIAFDEGEIAEFSRADDPRPRVWFSVKREDLVEFYPEASTDVAD